jgi:hypothetical protein
MDPVFTEDEVMCCSMDVCMCFYVFLELLVEQWDRCGQVTEGVMNGLLLLMASLILVIYCDGICIPIIYGGMWLY